MSEPAGQTVREILTIMAAGIRRSQCSDEPIRKQTLVKDKAEAAINAHIVSVLEDFRKHARISKGMRVVDMQVVDAAIAKYNQGEKS